jgi:hypothetical protein
LVKRAVITANHLFAFVLAFAFAFFASGSNPVRADRYVYTATFNVRADAGWQATGVSLRPGEYVHVEVISGEWSNGVPPRFGGGFPFDNAYVCNNSDCVEPIVGFPQGALIGRIGRDLYPIGRSLAFRAASNHELALRMNDGDEGLHDNVGEITVRITVWVGEMAQAFAEYMFMLDRAWQDTGVRVEEGDTVMIVFSELNASTYRGFPPEVSICVPGMGVRCPEPLPGYPRGALIARVGEQQMIGIGEGNLFTAEQSGSVEIRANIRDEALRNQYGGFHVRVLVWSN